MTLQVRHIRHSKKGKRFLAGSRKPALLGEGHSSKVFDIGYGTVVKRFVGTLHPKHPNLDRDIEFKNYVRLGLFRFPVIVPMKWTPAGLQMPKLRIVTRSARPHEYKAHGFTVVEGPISDTQLRILKDGLRNLGAVGICTRDVLHVGISATGKPYFFDIGGFDRYMTDIQEGQIDNRHYWKLFCDKIGRPDMGELYPEWPSLTDLKKIFGASNH